MRLGAIRVLLGVYTGIARHRHIRIIMSCGNNRMEIEKKFLKGLFKFGEKLWRKILQRQSYRLEVLNVD